MSKKHHFGFVKMAPRIGKQRHFKQNLSLFFQTSGIPVVCKEVSEDIYIYNYIYIYTIPKDPGMS